MAFSYDDALFILLAYLLGSFSAAVITCRILNLPDPRTVGSGNPGATNVLRYGNKKAAVLTLLLDIAKGAAAVLIAKIWLTAPVVLAAVGFAAFLGHLYPVFFNFQGGKGVATTFGALTALNWQAGLALLGTWLLIAAVFRYSSLAALTAAIFAPFYLWLFTADLSYTLISGAMSLLLIWRHRSNIRKLLTGKEDKIRPI